MTAFSKTTQNTNKPTSLVSQRKYAENTHFIKINKIQIVAMTNFRSLIQCSASWHFCHQGWIHAGKCSVCHPQPLLREPDALSSCLALPRTATTPWHGHRLCSKGRLSPAGSDQSAATPCSHQASGRGSPKEALPIPHWGEEGRK